MRVMLLFLLLSAVAASGQEAARVSAQAANAPAPPALPPIPPPLPPLPPRALNFRELINLPAADREKALAARSPEDRRVIEGKLKEYDALSPRERELRLRCLQLRLYLRPLMQLPPSNRLDALAAIPEPDHDLIVQRLKRWDELTPASQKEFLENELAVRTLVHPELAVPLRGNSSGVPQPSAAVESAIARWRTLPEQKRKEIHGQFRIFFQLGEQDKARSMQGLGEDERRQMEKTLRVLRGLTQRQRDACIDGLQRFANLSTEDRAQFLRNVELWQNMTPQERKLLRELVARFRPPLPPFPPMLPPPLPKQPLPVKSTIQLTNN